MVRNTMSPYTRAGGNIPREQQHASIVVVAPLYARPVTPEQCINKFRMLVGGPVAKDEIAPFPAAIRRLPELAGGELNRHHVTVEPSVTHRNAAPKGLF